jgi:hypothetical protein
MKFYILLKLITAFVLRQKTKNKPKVRKVEHYWYDSEIVREYNTDDEDAPEPDISLS